MQILFGLIKRLKVTHFLCLFSLLCFKDDNRWEYNASKNHNDGDGDGNDNDVARLSKEQNFCEEKKKKKRDGFLKINVTELQLH